ncbi:recombinase family protein [Pseudofrankia sp. BMG5.37]|uniref:recombinase family protein n=1 Tax=Pseudofrankia sp. BMG5.37 TaxID=3050035 RepID=UPI002895B654|nr:recombinase family protein [Pseudofrankia sp. BMG5.37]MDT3438284.1 recombinase family protein [Pseudofrankia sp. BMG5.37]
MEEQSSDIEQASNKKVIIYLRVGRTPGWEAAIDRQRQECEELARQLGARVTGVYADHGGSGRFQDRPGLRKLLGDLGRSRDVSWLLVSSRDKLGRNAADNRGVRLALDGLGVRLVSTAEGMPSNGPTAADRFTAQVHSTVAELYHRRSTR